MTTPTSTQLRDLILEMETDGRPRTLAQIRREIDEAGHSASPGQLAHALRHLTDVGALVKPRRGIYVISESAPAAPQAIAEEPLPADAVEPVPAAEPLPAADADEVVAPEIPSPRVAAREFSESTNRPASPTPTPTSQPAAPSTAVSQLVDLGSPLLWFVITGVALIVWGEVVGLIVAAVSAVGIFMFLRYRSKRRHHAHSDTTCASTLDVLHHERLSQQYEPAKHA